MFGVAYEFGLSRSVRDVAVLLDAVHGPAVGDRYTAPMPEGRYVDQVGVDPGRLRVAVANEAWSGVGIDPEVAASAVVACQALADAGHDVSEATPRVDWDGVVESCAVTAIAFIGGVFQAAGRQPDPNKLEAVSRRIMEDANHLSTLDLTAMFDTQNHRVLRRQAVRPVPYAPPVDELPSALADDGRPLVYATFGTELPDHGPPQRRILVGASASIGAGDSRSVAESEQRRQRDRPDASFRD